jgi:type IV pilus modification protein PilV
MSGVDRLCPTPPAGRAAPAARRSRRESGITLIEVLVAILVFTIGVLGLASVVPMGMKRVTTSAGDTRASELASERCEQILTTPYDDPDLDAGTHNDPGNPRDGRYNISWSVEVDQPLTSCKRVTVTVLRTGEIRSRARLVIVVTQVGG